jgi:hypothetical protein
MGGFEHSIFKFRIAELHATTKHDNTGQMPCMSRTYAGVAGKNKGRMDLVRERCSLGTWCLRSSAGGKWVASVTVWWTDRSASFECHGV